MAKAQKLQTNFNAGILSPYIEGRPDVAQFFNGVLTGRNVFLLPEGGMENAPGTKYITSTKDNGEAILIPFEPTDQTSFELEFGVGYVRFRKNGVVVMTTSSDLVTNGGFDTDLTGWTDGDVDSGVSSRTVLAGEPCLLLSVGPTQGVASREQTITTVVDEDYVLTFTILSGTVSCYVGTSSFGGQLSAASYTAGTYSVNFTATATTTYIGFRLITLSGSLTAHVDDIECRSTTLVPYEVTTNYNADDLDELKGHQGIRESVDVLFLCCSRVRPMELVYGGDTNWVLRESPFDPMPTYEADTDISGGTITLTPGATTGDNIAFTASSACFLNGDVGRVIKYGLARALIITFTSTTVVRADILVDFPDANPIPAGEWLLEGSPGGATLDVGYKQPIGRKMSATANVATFRSADVGKFIHTYGGVLEIIKFTSSTVITVQIVAELTDSDNWNPDAAPAGSWTLESEAWSDTLGWPSINEFFQGRYVLASNNNQQTTIWMSQTNNFYNFARGALATDALEYTHRSGRFNKTRWLSENGGALYYSDGFAEHSLKGPGVDQPVGGDTVPLEKEESHNGSTALRPIHVGSSLLFLNWSKDKVLASTYNFDRDAQIAKQSLFLSRDLVKNVDVADTTGIDNHAPAYVQEPIPLIFWRRNDGALLVHSYNDDPEGGNNGWTTYELDGDIESYCVTRRATQHVLSLIVKRTIDGNTVRYIEELTNNAHSRTESAWTELQTQSAVILTKTDSNEVFTFTGLDHLEGESVEVLMYKTGQANWQVPRFMGTFTVTSGGVTLNESINYACKLEIGKPLTPFVKTMRPAIPNSMVEGHLRKWTKCFLRLQKSSLPVVNDVDMQVHKSMDTFDQGPYLRSGDFFVDTGDSEDGTKWDWSLDGYVEITRNKPYPVRALMLAGEVEFSESMGEALNNEGTIHEP